MPPLGWVSFDEAEPPRRLGLERYLPSPINLLLPGIDGNPELEMRIEVIDDAPRCTSLQIRTTENGREVATRDLKAVRIENWIEDVVNRFAHTQPADGVFDWTRDDDPTAVSAVRRSRANSRKRVTDELLREVARIHRQAVDSGEPGGRAIEHEFGVTERTAMRYLRLCRDAGLLEHTERSERDG